MNTSNNLPFRKQNFLIMGIGIIVLVLGFVIMGLDKEAFGFGFLGLTLGPIVVLMGFGIQFIAILKKPKD